MHNTSGLLLLHIMWSLLCGMSIDAVTVSVFLRWDLEAHQIFKKVLLSWVHERANKAAQYITSIQAASRCCRNILVYTSSLCNFAEISTLLVSVSVKLFNVSPRHVCQEREREMTTRFSQPTSLITWLSARTPTILDHEWIHSPSKLVSDIKEIKTIKDETENVHVVLLSKKRSHSVSVRCKQSCTSLLKNSKVCFHQNTFNEDRPNSVNSIALGVLDLTAQIHLRNCAYSTSALNQWWGHKSGLLISLPRLQTSSVSVPPLSWDLLCLLTFGRQ